MRPLGFGPLRCTPRASSRAPRPAFGARGPIVRAAFGPFRAAPGALALACALACVGACAADDGDASDAAPVAPGDPRFVRDPALDVELASRRGADSHQEGTNCVQCHQRFGPGPGRFTVAGTAYGDDGAPRPDVIVRLTDATGDVVLEVESDTRGNFYSTAPLPLPEGSLFPSLESADGKAANAMPFGTSSGACNVCHAGGARLTLRPLP